MTKIYPHGTSIKNPLRKYSNINSGIGIRAQKIDSIDKTIGRIKYTDDIILPNMLFGKIVRSPHPHALIKKIYSQEILNLSGVVDIITGQDFDTKYGIIPWTKDEYPLARHKARYVGDAVAAVIAHSEREAHEAAQKLHIEYEILEPILDISQAKNNLDNIINNKAKIGNISKHVDLEFGDTKQALDNSYITHSQDFYFHNTTHVPIEPHCAIGDFTTSGILNIYSTTQVPHYLHKTLSEVLKLEEHKIRVIQPPVGGAFGGKSECFDLEFVTALAAIRLKQPVKILYTREEVFYAHRGRHPMNMNLTMGVSKDGQIQAVKNLIDIDGGAYASFGMITAFYAGQLLTGPTHIQNYHFKSTRYYTNKPACGPKRGHGSVQPRFAFEIMLDIMAEKLNINPIKLRKINSCKPNSKTINQQQIGSLGAHKVLDTVARASNFYEYYNKLPYGRGLGVASSMYISGTNYPVYPNNMPQSSIIIRLDRSGLINIFSGASDIGQGCNSILAQIASEELGVSLDFVRVFSGDTDITPVDLGAYSSRVTLMIGHAAQEALRNARKKIAQSVINFFLTNSDFSKYNLKNINLEQICFENNFIFLKNNPEIRINFKTGIIQTETQVGSLVFTGNYRTLPRGGDYRGGTIGASPAYSCTAHVADISVCNKTGVIKINKIYAAHDCGRAINPKLVEGQIEGSTYMGAAEVFLENFITDTKPGKRQGLNIGPNLLDYKIPTSLDTPEINSYIIECPDPNGPYGAKEAGEGPLHSTIPAIANALYDAVGIRLFDLPFTPEKVLQALNNK